MKRLKVAFAGFRHAHVFDVLGAVQNCPELEITSACEESQETREYLRDSGNVEITHNSFEAMLAETDCDIIAIGDTYNKHGELTVKSLEAGKHVVVDKPLCIDWNCQTRIEELSSVNNLCVGCYFGLRDSGKFRSLKSIMESGKIGRLVTISIFGRHPLSIGKRPRWYFEPHLHGGTLVDIGIHAVDLAMWFTGETDFEVLAAREWNAKALKYPHFKDAAQFMLKSPNGVGVLGDVSYLAPDGIGYSMDDYWLVVCHGTHGTARAARNMDYIEFASDSSVATERLTCNTDLPFSWFKNFLEEVAGNPVLTGVNTTGVLSASRNALKMKIWENTHRG